MTVMMVKPVMAVMKTFNDVIPDMIGDLKDLFINNRYYYDTGRTF